MLTALCTTDNDIYIRMCILKNGEPISYICMYVQTGANIPSIRFFSFRLDPFSLEIFEQYI